jgi:hypothetical protein
VEGIVEGDNVYLTDLLGRVKGKVAGCTDRVLFDVSALSGGVYVLQVRRDQYLVSRKILIQ